MPGEEPFSLDDLRRCELVEGAGWEDWWLSIPDLFRRRWETDARRFDTAVCIKTKQMSPEMHRFNRVIGLGVTEPANDRELDAIFKYYGDIPQFRIDLTDLSRPDDLDQRLKDRGMVRISDQARLIRDASPPRSVSTPLEIVEVGADWADEVGQVRVRGFGLPAGFEQHVSGLLDRPGWKAYLALSREMPVGLGILFIDEDIAWMVSGTVVEGYRGRGGQRALTAARIAEAEVSGCRLMTTETAVDRPANPGYSYRNMLRSGFQFAFTRRRYIST